MTRFEKQEQNCLCRTCRRKCDRECWKTIPYTPGLTRLKNSKYNGKDIKCNYKKIECIGMWRCPSYDKI